MPAMVSWIIPLQTLPISLKWCPFLTIKCLSTNFEWIRYPYTGSKFKSRTTQTILHNLGMPCLIWTHRISFWSPEKALQELFIRLFCEMSHKNTRRGCLTAAQTWSARAGISRACPGPLRPFYPKILVFPVSMAPLRNIKGKNWPFEQLSWMQ